AATPIRDTPRRERDRPAPVRTDVHPAPPRGTACADKLNPRSMSTRLGPIATEDRAVPSSREAAPPRPTPEGERPPASLYVVGGQQHSPRPLHAGLQPWYRYQKGIVLRVDLATRAV